MTQDSLTKKEQYDLEKKRKEEGRKKARTMHSFKRWVFIGVVALGLGAGGIFMGRNIDFRSASQQESVVLASNGMHWHSHLSIKILGEEQEIPAGIGLGVVENPIHTHETDGIIHMEFRGRVTADQVKLSKFFDVWGKTFSRDCIFDKCKGEEGKVKMLVNGQENLEFENYVMRDGDSIEILFE